MSNLTRVEQAELAIKPKMKQLSTLVQGDKTKASIYASAIKQLTINKNLRECDVNSIVDTAFEIVQAGLNPNPLFGQAYVVPFRIKGYTVAQLQIGYKGWISTAYRNGWKVRGVAVYDCDNFNIKFNGLEDSIDFEPNFDERNEDDGSWVYKNLKGVIVYAMDKDGNIFTEFVPFKKLEKLRLKSQNQKAGQLSYIWLEWAEEMYKAKAIKYVLTRLPITEQMMDIAVKEDKVYSIDPQEANTGADVEDKKADLNAIISQKPKQKKQPKEEEPIEAEIEEEKEVNIYAPHYATFIAYGIKRKDLQDFCSFLNLKNKDEVDMLATDPELLKDRVEAYNGYKAEFGA